MEAEKLGEDQEGEGVGGEGQKQQEGKEEGHLDKS